MINLITSRIIQDFRVVIEWPLMISSVGVTKEIFELPNIFHGSSRKHFYLSLKSHYELPWGHRKIFRLDESHTKWKFGTSEEIIATFFAKNTSKVWNLDHFTSPGFTQNSLFWLILLSKWNIDCSYLSWWLEFLPTKSISKLSCYRRVCWYFRLVGTLPTIKDIQVSNFHFFLQKINSKIA